MSAKLKTLIAGNWKMYGLTASLDEIGKVASSALKDDHVADMVLCPPATLVAAAAAKASGSPLKVGGQDCHASETGAHTGDLSAEMLADAGAEFVIVGHSERRTDHRETSEDVEMKAQAALRANLTPIICIGETRGERDRGQTLPVLENQLSHSLPGSHAIVIAYEPVWAIGTGLTPTVKDIAMAHDFIRDCLVHRFGEAGNTIRLLYGGSVKPSNAAELLVPVNVNGALVGGASLKADDFLAICRAAPTS